MQQSAVLRPLCVNVITTAPNTCCKEDCHTAAADPTAVVRLYVDAAAACRISTATAAVCLMCAQGGLSMYVR
jgi:uncharacterized protein YqiB (DUF1249 family)